MAVVHPLASATGGYANFSESTLVLTNNTLIRGNFAAANGVFPGFAAFDNRTGEIFVSSAGGPTTPSVSVINASTARVEATLNVGCEPGPIAVDSAAARVFVTCTSGASGTVRAYDDANLSLVQSIPVGSGPDGIVINSSTHRVYVANGAFGGPGNITVINETSGHAIASIVTGNGSQAIAIDPVTHDVYVANLNSNNVSIINVSTNRLASTVMVGGGPQAFAFSHRNGSAFVMNGYTNNMTVINGSTRAKVATLSVPAGGGAQCLAVDPTTGDIFIAEEFVNRVGILSPQNYTVFASARVGTSPSSIVYDPVDHDMYVTNGASSNVSILSTSTHLVVSTVATPRGPSYPLVAYPSGSVFTSESPVDIVTEINSSTHTVSATIPTAQEPLWALFDDSSDRLYVSESDTGTISVISGATDHIVATVKVGEYARTVALDTRTGLLWVVNSDSNNVSVINTTSDRVVASIAVGSYPASMVYDAVNDDVYVANYYSSNVSIINGTSLKLVRTVAVNTNPYYATVDPSNGEVFTMSSWNKNITAISASNNSVIANFGLAGAYPIALQFDPVHGLLDAATLTPNAVKVIDPVNHSVLSTIPVGSSSTSPNGLGLDPSTGDIYVPVVGVPGNGTVVIINGSSNRVVANVTVGSTPSGVVADAGAGVVFVRNGGSDNLSVMNSTSHRLVQTIPVGGNPSIMAIDPTRGTVFQTNEAQGTVSILRQGPRFAVNFTETGLPNGTAWSVTMSGTTLSSSTPMLGFSVINGSYTYRVHPLAGYLPLSSQGTVQVNGTAQNVVVAFAPAYSVDFVAHGLAAGVAWSVRLNGTLTSAISSTIMFEELNGSYAYAITPLSGWHTVLYNGTINVSGRSATVDVNWTRVLYAVSFDEYGLPGGTPWNVTIDNRTLNGSGATHSATVPNGTHPYSVSNVPGWRSSEYSGSLSIDGQGATVNLTWSRAIYSVVFNESGLPTGTNWTLTFNGSNLSSRSSSVSLSVPNGTYAYRIGGIPGFHLLGAGYAETLTVAGSSLAVHPRWALTVYNVSFSESGLSSGTSWSVWFNNSWHSSTGSSFLFVAPNGTLNYSIANIPGWHSSSYGGTVVINAAAAEISVSWVRVDYTVTLGESGLPAGATWSAVVGGQTLSGTGPLSWSLGNGTYGFRADPAASMIPHPGSGQLTVEGTSVTLGIVYLPVPKFAVAFHESGLPNGTAWSVILNGTAQASTDPNVTFELTNGTYNYSVSRAANQTPTVSSGSVQVLGSARVVDVVFAPPMTFAVVFQSNGLPYGTPWNVTVDGQSERSTSTTQRVLESNGTYAYSVAGVPGYHLPRYSGSFVVNGSADTIQLDWTRTVYSIDFEWATIAPPAPGAVAPGGGNWTLEVGTTTYDSKAGYSIRVFLPNGTYSYQAVAPTGYTIVVNASGSIRVADANATIQILFESTGGGGPGTSQNGSSGATWLWLVLVGGAVLVVAVVVGIWHRRAGRGPRTDAISTDSGGVVPAYPETPQTVPETDETANSSR